MNETQQTANKSLTTEEQLALAGDLVNRAADHFADAERAPDSSWWRDYFTLCRRSVVLTEDGWEDASVVEEYRKDDPNWEPVEVLIFDGEPTIMNETQPNRAMVKSDIRAAIWDAIGAAPERVNLLGIMWQTIGLLADRFPEVMNYSDSIQAEVIAMLCDLGSLRLPAWDQARTGEWALNTFGRGEKATPYARRVLAEAEELVAAAQEYDDRGYDLQGVKGELADTKITLDVMAHRFEIDSDGEADHKMDINAYMREWISYGDGTGRHKKKETS
jgi:NTP pyrophosphatase (non-canonical NTP hydrolase)